MPINECRCGMIMSTPTSIRGRPCIRCGRTVSIDAHKRGIRIRTARRRNTVGRTETAASNRPQADQPDLNIAAVRDQLDWLELQLNRNRLSKPHYASAVQKILAKLRANPRQLVRIGQRKTRRKGMIHSSHTNCKRQTQLHRIRTVRQQEEMSLRCIARRSKTTITKLRAQEQEDADLRLSDLYRWQRALNVPLRELLLDEHDLFPNQIQQRAFFLRVAKMALAVTQAESLDETRRLGENLRYELIRIMPELREVGPPAKGFGRSATIGKIAEHPIPDQWHFASDENR